MPGVGLHDVAMGDQRSAPIRRAAQRILIQGILIQGIPISVAQGILWFGRDALHVHCAVMCTARCVAQARCQYFDTVWAGSVVAASRGRCKRQLNTTLTFVLLNK